MAGLLTLRQKYGERSVVFDLLMIFLLVGSVAIVFWYETLDADSALRPIIEWIDLGLVFFFVAEWAWRVKRRGEGARAYAMKYSWELLGMVPLLLPLPSFLRALRLVRLVRILRVFEVVGRRIGVWERLARESHIYKVGLAAGILTTGGAALVWLIERDTNESLANFGEALWWAIVTVTTVGYGDITPISLTGRFIAAILMATGIGIVALLASSLANVLIRQEDPDAEGATDSPSGPDLVDQLERLSDLHAKGALSPEEFSAAKARLIDA